MEWLLEAILIIVALGGLELILWKRDRKRQEDQQATLDSIYAELAELNDKTRQRDEW